MRNTTFSELAVAPLRTAIIEADRKWGWYLALGVLLVLLGGFASSMAVLTTLLSIAMLGWIMLAAGAGLILLSFLTGKWSGFLLTLAAGALSAVTGIAMLNNPFSSAAAITLMVGTILIGTGIYRSAASIVMRFPNWAWSVLSGFASFVLGALLVGSWQVASLYLLGLYVGFDLIFHGLSWIMFSLRVHRLAGELEIAESERRAA
jgi:uncharacterized membrane protein HdeD (DUF308 family)